MSVIAVATMSPAPHASAGAAPVHTARQEAPGASVVDERPPLVEQTAVDAAGRAPGPSMTYRATGTPAGAFTAIGVSWEGTAVEGAVRARSSQVWGPWQAIEVSPDEGPDLGSAEDTSGTRSTSQLVWVGDGTAYEVALSTHVDDLRVHLVRDATAESAATNDAALAAAGSVVPGAPVIYTPDVWGARAPVVPPVYAASLRIAVVHHTVNSNDYAPEQVPGMLRAIQAFHMDTNGWNDIGYNFIVDRFGRIWQARTGDLLRPVIGGHAMGFNTGSVGVALLGDSTGTPPSAVALEAISAIVGWKLTLHSISPLGSTVFISGGSHLYPPGTPVPLDNVNGHLDTQATSCPGVALYSQLGAIRARAEVLFPNLTGSYDAESRVPGGLLVWGWAIDVNTSGAIAVHIYVDGNGYAVLANQNRPDVGAAYPAYGPAHGFAATVPASPGTHLVCAYAINDVPEAAHRLLRCRTVFVESTPFGSFELVERAPGGIAVTGWAIDPDTAGPATVHAYVDGVGSSLGPANVARPDVGAAYPGYGAAHGFRRMVPAASGTRTVCLYAVNTVGPGDNRGLACRSILVDPDPFGSLESVTPAPGGVSVRGWVIDPDSAGAAAVHIYVDGVGSAFLANGTRGDVGAAYPWYGPGHGFVASVAAGPGPHTVCAYAINSAGAGSNRLLGCRSITTDPSPIGSLDSVTVSGGVAHVRGWSIDPDTAGANAVHVYVGATGYAILANRPRGDIGAAFPAYGPFHGFEVDVAAPAGSGQLCVYAMNAVGGGSTRLLGCVGV